MERLLRLVVRKTAAMPLLRPGPMPRAISPVGVSILITSAPMSPNICAAHGPMTTVVRSTTRIPSNVPAISPPLLLLVIPAL